MPTIGKSQNQKTAILAGDSRLSGQNLINWAFHDKSRPQYLHTLASGFINSAQNGHFLSTPRDNLS
jgi:hypothetical protein